MWLLSQSKQTTTIQKEKKKEKHPELSFGILINSPVLWWQQYRFRHKSYIPVCGDILLTYKTKLSYVGTTQNKYSNLPQTKNCSLLVIGKGSVKWWKKKSCNSFLLQVLHSRWKTDPVTIMETKSGKMKNFDEQKEPFKNVHINFSLLEQSLEAPIKY